MFPSFVARWAGACALAGWLCLLGGCAGTRPSSLGDETRWQPQLLYLNRSPHRSLYVEVDAVAGTAPSDAELEQLRQFLAEHCDKPDGVRIVRENVIPREGARGLSHEMLACRYLKGPLAGDGKPAPAFIYVLFYDSGLFDPPAAAPGGPMPKHVILARETRAVHSFQPHAHLLPFPTIYVDRRFLAATPRSLLGLLLVHEAGHVLGLTQDPTHGVDNHCTNRNCIMRPKLMVDLPRALFSKHKTLQTNLCAQCQADLAQGRNGAPATNLQFIGPVLVRSEEGYCIATLPSQRKFFPGPPAKLDVAGFINQMRSDSDHPELVRSLHCWTHNWGELQDPRDDWPRQLAGLEKVKTDPLLEAREAGTNTVASLQQALARVYLNGDGLPTNEASAVEWLRKAAENGNAESQNGLGWCYIEGKGVAQDRQAALKWFQKAAGQGFARGQCNLGRCYANGDGVAQDPAEAARWFARSAAAGDVEGQRVYGQILAEGRGVPEDAVEAYKWLSLAAEQGDVPAAQAMAQLRSRLNPSQVRQGLWRAAVFARRHEGMPNTK